MKFEIPKECVERVNAFIEQEEKKTKGHYGAIGGGYTYSFIPTGLGVIFKVKNNLTGAEIDLTDYDSW